MASDHNQLISRYSTAPWLIWNKNLMHGQWMVWLQFYWLLEMFTELVARNRFAKRNADQLVWFEDIRAEFSASQWWSPPCHPPTHPPSFASHGFHLTVTAKLSHPFIYSLIRRCGTEPVWSFFHLEPNYCFPISSQAKNDCARQMEFKMKDKLHSDSKYFGPGGGVGGWVDFKLEFWIATQKQIGQSDCFPNSRVKFIDRFVANYYVRFTLAVGCFFCWIPNVP